MVATEMVTGNLRQYAMPEEHAAQRTATGRPVAVDELV